jgi:hypothetical protein
VADEALVFKDGVLEQADGTEEDDDVADGLGANSLLTAAGL